MAISGTIPRKYGLLYGAIPPGKVPEMAIELWYMGDIWRYIEQVTVVRFIFDQLITGGYHGTTLQKSIFKTCVPFCLIHRIAEWIWFQVTGWCPPVM